MGGKRYVCDKAIIECSLCTKPEGTLYVTSNTVKLQDKFWATKKDQNKTNLVFTGKCLKSPKQKIPCVAIIQPDKWINTGKILVQGNKALLECSTIKCNYGGVSIRIKDHTQKSEPDTISPTDVDGIIPICCTPPNWMNYAESEKQKQIQRYKEQNRRGDHPDIMKYHNTTNILGIDPRGERVSWCGTFINWVLLEAGYETFPTAFRALDWKREWVDKRGLGVSVNKPIYGAIGVKSRRGGGHVSFVVGVDDVDNPTYVYMLGGNQWGNSNNIPWGTKTRGGTYIKSVLFPSRYLLADWDFGFFVPKDYEWECCELKEYEGEFIIAASDGN